MKKLFLVIVALLSLPIVYAYNPESAFDANGDLDLTTYEYDENSNEFVEIFHSKNDVVWSKVVYRIVDLRFKQNYQLYTPLSADDPNYSSLLKVILLAMKDTMPVYAKTENGDFRPMINDEQKKVGEEVFDLLDLQKDLTKPQAERDYERVLRKNTSGDIEFNYGSFRNYAKNQLKYMIREVVFFDKHYSRIYSKITHIAPMHAERTNLVTDMPVMDALYGQILFWVPFDALRPYMAQQYVMPNKNENMRVTFDEFFTKKKYSSYIVGDNNIYSRMTPQMVGPNATKEEQYEAIQKEQKLIEQELLNIEHDIWEY